MSKKLEIDQKKILSSWSSVVTREEPSSVAGLPRYPWVKNKFVSPRTCEKKRCAVFTIVRDESTFLPVWLNHYRRFGIQDSDIYVLDNDTIDGSTSNLSCNVLRVPSDQAFDHNWLREIVKSFQSHLLSYYDCVLFAEVDELVFSDPSRFSNLSHYIDCWYASGAPKVRCDGYEVIHYVGREADLDFSFKITDQRLLWSSSTTYSKCLLSKDPLNWRNGFHDLDGLPFIQVDEGLTLVHLHWADFKLCQERHKRNKMYKGAVQNGAQSLVDSHLWNKFVDRLIKTDDAHARRPQIIPFEVRGAF